VSLGKAAHDIAAELFRKKVFPDQQIPCTILIYNPSDRARGADTENFKDQMFCDAYTMNLARAKVPTKIVESFVWKLHQSGIGYETIARYIGYKKSNVINLSDLALSCLPKCTR
jgi:hypothetical protein